MQRNLSNATPGGSPYDSLKGNKVWSIVEKAIQDLVDNHDMSETTHRDYIVGYICKKLEDQQ
jgi:hypothetical protein